MLFVNLDSSVHFADWQFFEIRSKYLEFMLGELADLLRFNRKTKKFAYNLV